AATGKPTQFAVHAESGLPPAYGDDQRHWQVLVNLLSNAIKFSAPGKQIDVEVTQEYRMLQVSVIDLGVGISSGDLPKLFRKLSRVGSPRELEVRGAGL